MAAFAAAFATFFFFHTEARHRGEAVHAGLVLSEYS